jgi:hypothetical protein
LSWGGGRGCQASHQSRPGARGRSLLGVGARAHSPLGSGLGAAHRSPLVARGLALASASGGGWDWEPGDGGRLELRDLPFLVGRGLESWVKKNM